jgi:hypothetical protein
MLAGESSLKLSVYDSACGSAIGGFLGRMYDCECARWCFFLCLRNTPKVRRKKPIVTVNAFESLTCKVYGEE